MSTIYKINDPIIPINTLLYYVGVESVTLQFQTSVLSPLLYDQYLRIFIFHRKIRYIILEGAEY